MQKVKSILLHTCCGPCCCYVIEKLQKDGFNVTLFYYNPNIHPKDEYEVRLEEINKYCEKIGINLVVDNYDVEKWFENIKGLEGEPEGGKRCEICFKMRLKRTRDYALSPNKGLNNLSAVQGASEERSKSYSKSTMSSTGTCNAEMHQISKSQFDYFGTTLTISPHKNAAMINKIGNEISTESSSRTPEGGERSLKESINSKDQHLRDSSLRFGMTKFYQADWKKEDGFKKSCQISKEENFYRQDYCGCIYSKK